MAPAVAGRGQEVVAMEMEEVEKAEEVAQVQEVEKVEEEKMVHR